MTTPHDGFGNHVAIPSAAADAVTGWALLGPFLMGACAVAVGLIIVCDFRGFATWHHQQADASVPSWLRHLSDGREGQRREANDRHARIIQKIVGCGFVGVGGVFAIYALIQGISELT
ncbi:hypothetical protein ACIP2X_08430 [Streptomyces sp. NPDC089424]|uniref:hypothetical protein n=1 Tax=Streptomyces sp. NPDC089424 TaxID=3365917 RepID=UPI0037FD6601